MVTQQLLSLAESPCKNGSLLSDGHCTFSPLCWSPDQSISKENNGTVTWVSRSTAVISTSISICKTQRALHAGLLVMSACDTTVLRLPCRVLRTPQLDPKLPGCCTMCNTYISLLSVTNDSCATCDLRESPEGHTQRPYLSKGC